MKKLASILLLSSILTLTTQTTVLSQEPPRRNSIIRTSLPRTRTPVPKTSFPRTRTVPVNLGLPDLRIRQFKFLPHKPQALQVQIANYGKANADTSVLRLTIRQIKGTAVSRTFNIKVAPIQKTNAQWIVIDAASILPKDVALADTTFRLYADATKIINESNEANNSKSYQTAALNIKKPILGVVAPALQPELPINESEETEPETNEPEVSDTDTNATEFSTDSSSNSIWSEVINEVGETVRESIRANAETEQKRLEYSNNQPTTESPDTSSVGSLPSESESHLPDKPPTIAQSVDSINEILTKWNWVKVDCTSNVVSIIGLGDETVCINPTSEIPAGQYQYNLTAHQLTPLNKQEF